MRSRFSLTSYAVVLRAPHAVRTFGAALVGRLSYGVVFLSLVLAVTRVTGSYAMAGGVVAVFGLASSVLSPFRARLLDRHGPRRALPPMAAVYALLLGVLAGATWQPGCPRVLLWALGAASGASTPPLGPLMRGLWGVLVPGRDLLQRAFSLDTVAEELLFVVGPLLAGLLAAYTDPALGLAVSAGLVLAGSLVLVSSPVVRSLAVPEMGGATPENGPPAGPGAAVTAPGRHTWLWRVAAVWQPVLMSGVVGLGLGAVNILAVTFAGRHHAVASVAWVEAALAVGSAVGGLMYGSVGWRASIQVRLVFLACGLGVSLAVAGLSPGIWALAAVLGFAGLFVSPALATGYLMAEEIAVPGARTEAGTWVNTAYNVGNSAGTAGIGLVLARVPLAVCFAITAAAVLGPAIPVAVRFTH
ncbi:MAG TPA: MFS transporter [Streptosporangiaceae bacterium]|nr:MFS transporter [Streptosporangiaceae bacterium]